MDDNKAAIVWVILPGFMKRWQRNALFMVRRDARRLKIVDRASGLSLNQRSEGGLSTQIPLSQQIFPDLKYRLDRELFSIFDEARGPVRSLRPATSAFWPNRRHARR